MDEDRNSSQFTCDTAAVITGVFTAPLTGTEATHMHNRTKTIPSNV